MVDLNILVNRRDCTLGRLALSNSRVALRAITAARLYASGQAETVAVAAACTGSTPIHVRAAVVVLKSEDEQLLDRILRGDLCLLAAAKAARGTARLVDAYRRASEQDLVRAARVIGCIPVPEHAYRTAAE